MTRPGRSSWYQEPVPPEYSCVPGLPASYYARVLLRNLARPETGHWPGSHSQSVARVQRERRPKWSQTEISWDRIITRSQSIEAVTSNWSIIGPGERAESGAVTRTWSRDVTNLCTGVLAPSSIQPADCGLTECRHLTEIYGGSSLQLIEFHGARVSSYGSQFNKVRKETISYI